MSTFKDILAFTLKWEAGFSNHPNDFGGRTDKGISEAFHPQAWVDGKISMEEAREIYRKFYWEPIRGDDLPPLTASVLFDFKVMSGSAINILQDLVGTTSDGVIGPVTINAVEHYADKLVAEELLKKRRDYYKSLVKKNSSLKVFSKGWTARLNNLAEWLKR